MTAPSSFSGTAREGARLFWSVATPQVRRRLIVAFGVVAVAALLPALGPLLLKDMVDTLAEKGSTVSTILGLAVAYAALLWLGRLAAAYQSYLQSTADRRINRMLSERYFDHVIRLPLCTHVQRQTGAVNETLSNGLSGYQMVLQVLLVSFVPVAVQVAMVSTVLMMLGQGVLLVMILGAAAAYGVAFGRGAVQTNQSSKTASAAQIDARALMTDGILNYETIKYFTAERLIRERARQALARSEQKWKEFFRLRAGNAALVGTVFALFVGCATVHAALQVHAGTMTIGTMVLANAYLVQLVGPIELVGAAAQSLAQGFAFIERMLELLKETAEPPQHEEAVPLSGRGELRFENVSAGYLGNGAILRDVSFVIPGGETLGIVGASGAGKSTLVRLLTRLIEPSAGRILIDAEPVHDMELASVRGAIAVVPQDTVLFDDTIAYNIGFGRPGSTQAEIEAAAKLAHLHELILRLPEGYATRVGERGVRLSGGERQRVSIARAALKRPRIYVFDEATSSLDSRVEREILANIRELSRHATTLIIAHRLSTVVHANQIIVLDSGTIVECGTHEALVQTGGKYAALWDAQRPDHRAASVARLAD